MEITSALVGAVPTACASCVFGAASSAILSFTSSYIEHITVSVTPHITVYTNGSRSTSLESNTLTKSSVVGGLAGSDSSKTYARKDDITWTVDGATLTYPTKYVQYLGFKGAPAPTDDGETCAEETEASDISLPATTDGASFIYPLPANATALALPTQLLQYLGSLDGFAEQYDGLSGCAPLDGGHHGGSNGRGPRPGDGNQSMKLPTQTLLPSGYAGATDSAAPGLSSDGYASSSGFAWLSTSLRPTGYITTSSSVSITSSESSSADEQTSSTSISNSYGTSSYRASSTSGSRQASSSSSRFTILPHPYLNSTTSRSSAFGQSASYVVSDTSDLISTTSSGLPGYGGETLTSETAMATTSMTARPPKGSVGVGPPRPGTDPPPGMPPVDNGDGDDDGDGDGNGLEPPTTAVSYATSRVEETALPSAPAYVTPPSEGENVHTTAFVIEPITGSALITYQSGPTQTKGKGEPTGPPGGGDNKPGSIGSPDGYQDSDETKPDSGPDVGNLIDQIGNVANGGQEGSNEHPTNDGADDAGTLPGSDGSWGSGSGQHQPGEQVGSAGQQGPGQRSGGNGGSSDQGPPAQGQGMDLISAINTVVHRGGAGSVYSGHNTKITAQPGGAVVIGEQTVSPGQSVTIGSGPSTTVVALQTKGGSTNLIVGGSTIQVLPHGESTTAAPGSVEDISSMALITTNGQTLTAVQSGSSLILLSGSSAKTVAAGQAATFAGETVLAVPTEEAVFVNGYITPLTAAEGVDGASQAVMTANGHTITALDAGKSLLLVDGLITKTVQDGSDVTFQGQTISAQQSGMAVVVNGHTSSLTSAMAFATGQAVVTANGHTFSALDLPGYVVLQDGTSSLTLRDDATVPFDGQLVTALGSGRNAVVVDDRTMSMTSPVGLATAQAVITAGSHTFTVQDMEGYVVLQDRTSTVTLKDGKTTVFDGQTIKALPSGHAVLVNGQTKTFTSLEASPTDDVGGYINKGLSGGGGTTSSPTVGAAGAEATGAPGGNGASVLSTGWTGLIAAGFIGVVAML